jgi:hypothetical protein
VWEAHAGRERKKTSDLEGGNSEFIISGVTNLSEINMEWKNELHFW